MTNASALSEKKAPLTWMVCAVIKLGVGCAVLVSATRKYVATHALFKDINVGVSNEPLDPSSPSMEPYPNIWSEKHTYKGSERVVERSRMDKIVVWANKK